MDNHQIRFETGRSNQGLTNSGLIWWIDLMKLKMYLTFLKHSILKDEFDKKYIENIVANFKTSANYLIFKIHCLLLWLTQYPFFKENHWLYHWLYHNLMARYTVAIMITILASLQSLCNSIFIHGHAIKPSCCSGVLVVVQVRNEWVPGKYNRTKKIKKF